MASSSARPLQLDQWANTKAPLTPSQRASVNRLAEWLHRNSSDFKQQHAQHLAQAGTDDRATSANLPAPHDQKADTHRSADAQSGPPSTTTSDTVALPDPKAPLASAQSFLAWYTQLSDSVSNSTQSSHLQALQRISDTTSTADQLLAQLEACQINVSELRAGTAFVQDSSRGIREQAQALLDAQIHLDTLAEDISSRLSFFTLLPYATTMLSSPDSSIVYSQAFLELLDQLEMALLFLQQEPAKSYRDAGLYRMRYSQCVTRAATLAKLAVVRDIKTKAEDSAERLKQLETGRTSTDSKAPLTTLSADAKGKARELSDHTTTYFDKSSFAKDIADVVFGDATHQVTKLRPLIFELQKRANNTTAASAPNGSTAAEFQSLLQECRSAWFQCRRPLLSRILLKGITTIEVEAEAAAATAQPSSDSSHPLVLIAREGTTLLRHVLQSEYALYQQFFGVEARNDGSAADAASHGKELGIYLAELAETVISRLRPKLAKEEDLLVLSQTSSIIADAVHATGYAEPRLDDAAWSRSLQPLLNESLARLNSRAQSLISSNIANFSPSEEDGELEFPERIQGYKSSATSQGLSQLSITSPGGAKVANHRRGKSGAGLLDAALSASHTASSSTVHQEKVELFTLPAALSSTYYAPVGYMLELLYHLQARVPPTAFRRIAMAAVDACLTSVAKGSQALLKRKKGESIEREDGWLFELRQLELLREAVVSAELVLKQSQHQNVRSGSAANSRSDNSVAADVAWGTTTLVDLSSLVTAINSLWNNTGRLLYPSTTSAKPDPASAATAQLDMGPCSTAVATMLQDNVNELSSLWCEYIALPMRVYLDQNAAEASSAKFLSTYRAFETCIQSIIPDKAAKLALWIEDQELHKLVVHTVAEKVAQTYARFYESRPAAEVEPEAVEMPSQVQARVAAEWFKGLRG